ncbi:GLPGLI family protein [Chryseobacterium gossypii]|uniref:GLPGLI family protein n=1 Tax=Chryseobacterium gossypii TaxID=3231602 RepID=UPI003525CD81
MKVIYGIILSFFSALISGQNKIFTYEYTFVPDSTAAESKLSEIMILNAGKDKSEYYSQQGMKIDSVLLSNRKKGNFEPYTGPAPAVSDRIIKYYSDKTLDHLTTIGSTRYLIEDNREPVWKLLPGFKEILGLKVLKATTSLAGREWIAWFSNDIPLQDGPYKFRGLPGLIIQIEDSRHQHSFVLRGIRNTAEDFIYPEIRPYKTLPRLTYPQYVKVYQKYREDPLAEFHTDKFRIPDQADQSGNIKSGQQILREMEIKEKERLRKDNNIIEKDLLK